MADTVRTQVITEVETKYGTFRDAIYYKNEAEYKQAILDGTHEIEKATRVANYVEVIEKPAPVVEISKEQLQEAKAQLEAQVAELVEQIKVAKPQAVLDAQVDTIEVIK